MKTIKIQEDVIINEKVLLEKGDVIEVRSNKFQETIKEHKNGDCTISNRLGNIVYKYQDGDDIYEDLSYFITELNNFGKTVGDPDLVGPILEDALKRLK